MLTLEKVPTQKTPCFRMGLYEVSIEPVDRVPHAGTVCEGTAGLEVTPYPQVYRM